MLKKEFHVIPISYSENNIWPIKGGRFFGHGTTYGDNLVYHQFEIRKNNDKFINKCNEILNGK